MHSSKHGKCCRESPNTWSKLSSYSMDKNACPKWCFLTDIYWAPTPLTRFHFLYPIVFVRYDTIIRDRRGRVNGLQKCYLYRSSSKAPSWCTCFDWWTCPGFGLNSGSTAKRDSKVFLKHAHIQRFRHRQVSNTFERNWIIACLHDNYRPHK